MLEKAKKTYLKEKPAEYYLQNKEFIKEKAWNRYKNLSEEEKHKIKEYQKKRCQELNNSWFCFKNEKKKLSTSLVRRV